MSNARDIPLSTLRKTNLSSIYPSDYTRLSTTLALSSEIVEGLSNQINPQLSTIAGLVEVETARLDELSTSLATVAKTGSYNDLSDKPNIPTKVSQLQNDAGYLTAHQSLTSLTSDVSKLSSGLSSVSSDLFMISSSISSMDFVPLSGGDVTSGFYLTRGGIPFLSANQYGIAIGNGAIAKINREYSGVAVGANSFAGELNAWCNTAIGNSTSANNFATAIGFASKATGNGSTALGAWAKAPSQNDTIIGHSSENQFISQWRKTIIGSESKTLSGIHNGVGIVIGNNNSLRGSGIILGYNNSLHLRDSKVIGNNYSVDDITPESQYAIAIGDRVSISCPYYAIAIGDNAVISTGQYSGRGIAIGESAKVYGGYDGLAIGGRTQVSSPSNISTAIAIGGYSKAIGNNSIAFGKYAVVSAANAIQLGGYNTNNAANTFQVGKYRLLNLNTGNIPEARVSAIGYLKQADLPSIPTKTSDLQNDSGFITSSYVSLSAVEETHSVSLTEEQKTALVASSGIPAEAWGDFAITINPSTNEGSIGNIDCFSVVQNSNGDLIFVGGMPALDVLGWIANVTVIQGSSTHTILSVGTTSADLALKSEIEGLLPLDGGGQITGGFGVVDSTGTNLIGVNNYGSVTLGYGSKDVSNDGVAIGYKTSADAGCVAIGELAAALGGNSVQIGHGTNSTPQTLQFRNYQLLDSAGNIPFARLSANLSGMSGDYVPLSGGVVSSNFILKNPDNLPFLTNNGATLGLEAEASGTGAVAYGTSALAQGHESVALGNDAQVSGALAIDGIAIGYGAQVIAQEGVLAQDIVQIGVGTNVIPHSLKVYGTHVLSSQSGNSSTDLEICDAPLSAALVRQGGRIRNVLPILSSNESSIQLTKDKYVYRVVDESATGAFPTLTAPTDIQQSGPYYFTFEIEWTTSAALASYTQTFDWINYPEMVSGGSAHTYYITGRWDSAAGTYTMNCWRVK